MSELERAIKFITDQLLSQGNDMPADEIRDLADALATLHAQVVSYTQSGLVGK